MEFETAFKWLYVRYSNIFSFLSAWFNNRPLLNLSNISYQFKTAGRNSIYLCVHLSNQDNDTRGKYQLNPLFTAP